MTLQEIKPGDFVARITKVIIGSNLIEKVQVTKVTKNYIYIDQIKYNKSSGNKEKARDNKYTSNEFIMPWTVEVEQEIMSQQDEAEKVRLVECIKAKLTGLPLETLRQIASLIGIKE